MTTRTKQKVEARESLLFLLLVVGVLAVFNILAVYIPLPRLDLTHNRLFSLAPGSKKVATNLADRLEFTAYFTKDLPPPFNATEQQVRDLLGEYEAASKGRIFVRFVNPDDEKEQGEARAAGIQAVAHQNIENDKVSVVEGYRGLVIKYLGKEKTIPVIENTEGLEYTITSALKELTGDKRPLGVVKKEGSPSMEQGLSKLSGVLPTYEVKNVDLTSEIESDLGALLIVDPTSPFTETELRRINKFVMKGGSLGVFGGALKVNISSGPPAATAVDTSINTLLQAWGVKLKDKMVADARCGRAPMQGPFGMQVLVPYPPIPIIQLSDEERAHPVLFQLNSPLFPFSAALDVSAAPANTSVKVLARSSEDSWLIQEPSVDLTPKNPREWNPSDARGPFALIAAIEGTLPSAFPSEMVSTPDPALDAPANSEKPVRVLVFGTGSFLRDEFLPNPSQNAQAPSNAATALALNAIDWLATDADLIAIRAKTVEEPALNVPEAVLSAENEARSAAQVGDKSSVDKALEQRKSALTSWDKKKALYRWSNTLGIPILFALFGIIRWRRRTAFQKGLSYE